MLSSGRHRVLSVSCVFAVLAGGVLPVPAWADPGVSGVGPVSVAGAESAALAAAARSGEPVVVDALTTQTSVVTANPDGVLTMSSSSRPVRVREGSGWVPVDTSVVRGSDGRFTSRAVAVDASFSAGGQGPLVELSAPDGGVVTLSLPFDLPVPSVSGATLTYANVLPDVDVVVEGLAESFTEVVVVKTRQALADERLTELRVAVTTSDGLDLVVGADGRSVVNDSRGRMVFAAPAAGLWDSRSTPAGPAPSATEPAVVTPSLDVRVVGESQAGGVERTEIVLSTPDGVLADPVFPVFIDPSFGLETQTYVTAWSDSVVDVDEPGGRFEGRPV